MAEKPASHIQGEGVRTRPPRWAHLLPFVSLAAVSSAAPVLRMMHAVPPLTRASWRQQLTTLVLLPMGACELVSMPSSERARLVSLPVVGRFIVSSFALALHFGLWIQSIDWTTIPHSVLFVSTSPVILAVGRAIGRLPISMGEVLGSLAGFGGICISMIGASMEQEHAGEGHEHVTMLGDLAALGAAFAFVVYFLLGQGMRQWIPTTVYVVPVFGLSAIMLSAGAALLESATLSPPGKSRPCGHLLGWASWDWVAPSLYLALGPGVCGHTLLNASVRYVSPLVISIIMLGEPVLSSVIGYLMGVSDLPGAWTLAGGPLFLAGCAWTIAAARRRESGEAHGSSATGTRPQLHGALQLAEDWSAEDVSSARTQARG